MRPLARARSTACARYSSITTPNSAATPNRARKPTTTATDSTGATTLTQADVNAFKLKWNIDPIETFTSKAQVGSNQKATQWDIWLTQLKSYVDFKDTDNQKLQGEISQKSNRRSEVIEAMASFAGKESKTGSMMATALG